MWFEIEKVFHITIIEDGVKTIEEFVDGEWITVKEVLPNAS